MGRRLVEWDVLFSNLRHCAACGLGPINLSSNTVAGERIVGLGGYLYVRCECCDTINCASYGHRYKTLVRVGERRKYKTTRVGFSVNTKLGAGKSFVECLHSISVSQCYSYKLLQILV